MPFWSNLGCIPTEEISRTIKGLLRVDQGVWSCRSGCELHVLPVGSLANLRRSPVRYDSFFFFLIFSGNCKGACGYPDMTRQEKCITILEYYYFLACGITASLSAVQGCEQTRYLQYDTIVVHYQGLFHPALLHGCDSQGVPEVLYRSNHRYHTQAGSYLPCTFLLPVIHEV